MSNLDKIKTLDEKIKTLELEKQKLQEKHLNDLAKKVSTYLSKAVSFAHPHHSKFTSDHFVIGALKHMIDDVKESEKKIDEIIKKGEAALPKKRTKKS